MTGAFCVQSFDFRRMSLLRFALTLIACLLVSAAPTQAQEGPEAADVIGAAPVAPAVEGAEPAEKSEEEREIESMAVAFSANLVKMQDALVAAYPDGDIEAVMQPVREEAGLLADRIASFLRAKTDAMEPGAARTEAEASDAKAANQVRQLPDVIKSVVLRGLAAAAAAETDAPQPAEEGETPPPAPESAPH